MDQEPKSTCLEEVAPQVYLGSKLQVQAGVKVYLPNKTQPQNSNWLPRSTCQVDLGSEVKIVHVCPINTNTLIAFHLIAEIMISWYSEIYHFYQKLAKNPEIKDAEIKMYYPWRPKVQLETYPPGWPDLWSDLDAILMCPGGWCKSLKCHVGTWMALCDGLEGWLFGFWLNKDISMWFVLVPYTVNYTSNGI